MGGQRFLVPPYEAPAHDILVLRAKDTKFHNFFTTTNPLRYSPSGK